jgi:hypothetical protein
MSKVRRRACRLLLANEETLRSPQVLFYSIVAIVDKMLYFKIVYEC